MLTSATQPSEERGFTGHEHLDDVSLVHMNGRLYDPVMGRMASADPIVPDALDSQSYNRYSYVINNPLKYDDPSGYEPVEIVVTAGGGITWSQLNRQHYQDYVISLGRQAGLVSKQKRNRPIPSSYEDYSFKERLESIRENLPDDDDSNTTPPPQKNLPPGEEYETSRREPPDDIPNITVKAERPGQGMRNGVWVGNQFRSWPTSNIPGASEVRSSRSMRDRFRSGWENFYKNSTRLDQSDQQNMALGVAIRGNKELEEAIAWTIVSPTVLINGATLAAGAGYFSLSDNPKPLGLLEATSVGAGVNSYMTVPLSRAAGGSAAASGVWGANALGVEMAITTSIPIQ